VCLFVVPFEVSAEIDERAMCAQLKQTLTDVSPAAAKKRVKNETGESWPSKCSESL
jgi:hypothetical protein